MADSQYRLGSKLHQIRTNYNLTIQQLARLSNLPGSLISHIENGHRNPSKEVLDSLADALGLQRENWFQDWSFEEIVTARIGTYDRLLVKKTNDGSSQAEVETEQSDEEEESQREVILRSTLTWQAESLTKVEAGSWVKYEAHKTMSNSGRYTYVTEEEALQTSAGLSKRFSLFNGGTSQIALFKPLVHQLDRLVIDAHLGEETYYVIKGEMAYVVLERPTSLMPRKIRQSPHKDQVQMEVAAADMVLYQSKENHSASEFEQFQKWFMQFTEKKVSSDYYEGEFYNVPCEVFTLKQGDVLRIDSRWPHGGMAILDAENENQSQAFFSAVGSFFIESTMEPPVPE